MDTSQAHALVRTCRDAAHACRTRAASSGVRSHGAWDDLALVARMLPVAGARMCLERPVKGATKTPVSSRINKLRSESVSLTACLLSFKLNLQKLSSQALWGRCRCTHCMQGEVSKFSGEGRKWKRNSTSEFKIQVFISL